MTVVSHTKTSPDTTSLQWTAHRTSGIETLQPDAWRRLRGKTRTASVDQEITNSSSAITDNAKHTTETAGDHDDKRRRIMNLKHHFRQLLKKKVLNRTQSCLNWRQTSMNLLWLTSEEKGEFLKSMETEWQTLLKNQAAKVLCTLARSCDGHSLGSYLGT